MLIPRFSLLQLLAITSASAVFCYLLAMASQGHHWAIALSVAISSLLCAVAVYSVLFVIAWMLTQVGGLLTKQRAVTSPFAHASPPPQFVTPPEDQE